MFPSLSFITVTISAQATILTFPRNFNQTRTPQFDHVCHESNEGHESNEDSKEDSDEGDEGDDGDEELCYQCKHPLFDEFRAPIPRRLRGGCMEAA